MNEEDKPAADENFIAELRVFKQEDRTTLASILFKNGYTVRQGKRLKKEGGKSVDYTVIITDRNGEQTEK